MGVADNISRIFRKIGSGVMILTGEHSTSGTIPLTESEYAKIYERKDSFTDYLPWIDYDPRSQVFEFDDYINVGAMFELFAVDVDGKPKEVVEELDKNLVRALHTIPELDENPWIVQLFLNDEPIDPDKQIAQFREYATPSARDTRHASAWFEELRVHYKQLRRGIFKDPATGLPFKAKTRKVRLCFYRRAPRSDYLDSRDRPLVGVLSPAEELNTALVPFIRMLEQVGIASKRCTGKDMYEMMLPWFSPKPSGYDSAYEYMEDKPYPDEEDRAIAFDLAAAVTTEAPFCPPEGADVSGVLLFNDQPQRFISIAAIDTPPTHGLMTSDQVVAGTKRLAMWDQMPENSVLSMSITIRAKYHVDSHINRLLSKTGGGSYDEDIAIEQAEDAQSAMAHGRRMYPMLAGAYIRSSNMKAMVTDTLDALTVMRSMGLNPTDPATDPISGDCYLKSLPFCYDERFDKNKSMRSRLTYDSHITRLLPLFGRGVGTGNPGQIFFNRIGQNMFFDPFSVLDRKKSSHGVIFGPTGSGKSAFINYTGLHSMAMRMPRQFYIEKGGSFDLIAKWFRRMGMSVQQYTFTPSSNISLPPYARSKEALRQISDQAVSTEASLKFTEDDDLAEPDFDEDYDENQRDYLGEMELSTQMMISGADEKAADSISQQDRRTIQKAIIAALRESERVGSPHPIISDVCTQLSHLYEKEDSLKRKDRIREMEESLSLWTEAVRGRFFNRFGEDWPECDATFFDMGMLTQEQNKDMLAVAVVSLVNAITGIGEKYEFDERSNEVTIDEGHIISKNPVLVKPFVFGVKTWRKLDISLQNATQNLGDYPDNAVSMLNLAEWWYCLVMPKQEIDDISRFRTLNDEQKSLLASATKASGMYTEGVVMSDDMNSLFRVVLPGLALGLAGTDPKEKIQRRKIIDEMGFSGKDAMLDAGIEVGKRITAARNGILV